jgi:hypothetical protein
VSIDVESRNISVVLLIPDTTSENVFPPSDERSIVIPPVVSLSLIVHDSLNPLDTFVTERFVGALTIILLIDVTNYLFAERL